MAEVYEVLKEMKVNLNPMPMPCGKFGQIDLLRKPQYENHVVFLIQVGCYYNNDDWVCPFDRILTISRLFFH